MGYQDAVQQELGDAAAVWGPELNGGNSRNVLTHLDEWVLFRKPDLVKINCFTISGRSWPGAVRPYRCSGE